MREIARETEILHGYGIALCTLPMACKLSYMHEYEVGKSLLHNSSWKEHAGHGHADPCNEHTTPHVHVKCSMQQCVTENNDVQVAVSCFLLLHVCCADFLYISFHTISTSITQSFWQVQGSLEDAWQKLEGCLVFGVLHRLERVPKAFSFVARLPAAKA